MGRAFQFFLFPDRVGVCFFSLCFVKLVDDTYIYGAPFNCFVLLLYFGLFSIGHVLRRSLPRFITVRSVSSGLVYYL